MHRAFLKKERWRRIRLRVRIKWRAEDLLRFKEEWIRPHREWDVIRDDLPWFVKDLIARNACKTPAMEYSPLHPTCFTATATGSLPALEAMTQVEGDGDLPLSGYGLTWYARRFPRLPLDRFSGRRESWKMKRINKQTNIYAGEPHRVP
jgi:hypothetical protein